MLYLVPSRSRPHNIPGLIDAWDATRTHARMWVCVDGDDPSIADYRALARPDWCELHETPSRLYLGPKLNHFARLALTSDEQFGLLGFMGDDARPRTLGWDTRFQDVAQSLGTCVVYGNDLIQGAALPTSVALSTDIVHTLGYYVPPSMRHLFTDNYWKHLGEGIGCLRYLPDVIIEHMHPLANKGAWDEIYREVNSGEMWDHDSEAFAKWKINDAAGAIRAVKADQRG